MSDARTSDRRRRKRRLRRLEPHPTERPLRRFLIDNRAALGSLAVFVRDDGDLHRRPIRAVFIDLERSTARC